MVAVSEKAKEKQKKYKQEFAKEKYKRVPLDLQKDFYNYVKAKAESEGKTINGYIREAIDEKNQNVKEELPPNLIPDAIKWLRDHGHSADEIVDFLQTIAQDDAMPEEINPDCTE